MRIDGVSRETGPHLFVYSHFLVIPSMILTNNDHEQMTTVLKSDYSVHVINNESPQLSQLRACFMKTYYKFKTVENFYYDLLECNIYLYPTQLVMPSVVAIAVKKLMAI